MLFDWCKFRCCSNPFLFESSKNRRCWGLLLFPAPFFCPLPRPLFPVLFGPFFGLFWSVKTKFHEKRFEKVSTLNSLTQNSIKMKILHDFNGPATKPLHWPHGKWFVLSSRFQSENCERAVKRVKSELTFWKPYFGIIGHLNTKIAYSKPFGRNQR